MYKVYFSNPNLRVIAGIVETKEEALQLANSLGAFFLEEDVQNPGCFDGIDKHGRVICVEPTDFKLAV